MSRNVKNGNAVRGKKPVGSASIVATTVPRAHRAARPPARILVVDDDPDLLQLVNAILRNQGFEVEVAGSVPQALQKLNTSEFDLVLSDMNIGHPGDGYTVISAARRIRPQVVTLIMTGFPDFQGALESIRQQADDYMVKPVPAEHLVTLVQQSLRKHHPRQSAKSKKVCTILRENRPLLIECCMDELAVVFAGMGITMSPQTCAARLASMLDQVIVALKAEPSSKKMEPLSSHALEVARSLGRTRCRQGFPLRMLLWEIRILQREIFLLNQSRLLDLDISLLLPDMVRVTDTLQAMMAEAVCGYIDQESKQPKSRIA